MSVPVPPRVGALVLRVPSDVPGSKCASRAKWCPRRRSVSGCLCLRGWSPSPHTTRAVGISRSRYASRLGRRGMSASRCHPASGGSSFRCPPTCRVSKCASRASGVGTLRAAAPCGAGRRRRRRARRTGTTLRGRGAGLGGAAARRARRSPVVTVAAAVVAVAERPTLGGTCRTRRGRRGGVRARRGVRRAARQRPRSPQRRRCVLQCRGCARSSQRFQDAARLHQRVARRGSALVAAPWSVSLASLLNRDRPRPSPRRLRGAAAVVRRCRCVACGDREVTRCGVSTPSRRLQRSLAKLVDASRGRAAASHDDGDTLRDGADSSEVERSS